MRIAINMRLVIEGKMDGIGRFALESVVRVVRQHPEHEFFLFFDRRAHSSIDWGENVHCIVLQPPARHPILWWWFFHLSIPRAIKRYNIDLFVSTDGFMPLHPKVPTLNVIHDLNFEHNKGNLRLSHQYFMSHFMPRYAQNATRIATVSNFSRNDIATTYQVPESKIGVVYNGAHSNYHPLDSTSQHSIRHKYTNGCRYFLFVSTILPRKNLAGVLKAFDQMVDSSVESFFLLVVGAPRAWHGTTEQTYLSMKHRDSVRLLGHVQPDLLSQLMASATALVYPSFFEGFGIPIIEAFAAETAVITSNTTSMPEVAGDAALLVDPHNVNDIMNAMQKVASSQLLREKLIERGRIQRTLFSWDRTAELLWEQMIITANKQ